MKEDVGERSCCSVTMDSGVFKAISRGRRRRMGDAASAMALKRALGEGPPHFGESKRC